MKIIIDEINVLPEDSRHDVVKKILYEIIYVFLSTNIKTLRLEHNCSWLENMFPQSMNANIESVRTGLPEGLKESNIFIATGMLFVENKQLEEGTIQPLVNANS